MSGRVLTALVALLSLLSLAATPAVASVWSATLTVKDLGSDTFGCDNNDTTTANKCSNAATLSEDAFQFNNTAFEVTKVTSVPGGSLTLQLNSAPTGLTTDYELRIDSTSFALADAALCISICIWTNSGPTWTAGMSVSLSLRLPVPPSTVSLSASPNPVPEGSSVRITATLSAAMTSSVWIPVGLIHGTAEPGDLGSLSNIRIDSGATTGTSTVLVNNDDDTDDETFRVALGSPLPADVLAGDPSSVSITIDDLPPPGSPTALSLILEEVCVTGQHQCGKRLLREGSYARVRARINDPAPAGGLVVALTFAGTATRGTRPGESDYWATTEQIYIPTRRTTGHSVVLDFRDDGEADGGETVVVKAVSDNPALTAELTLTVADSDGTGTGTGTGTPTGTPTGTGTGGGGGGGGRQPRSTPDQHGNTPAEATSLNPRRYTTGSLSRRIDARLQRRTDVDYFQVEIPHAGVLTATTTGGVDTTGRVYQAQEEGEPMLLTDDTDSGPGRNFALGAGVEPGTYYLAVSAGASFGNYRLRVDYTPAFVENPAPTSPQSGLGLIAGWVCAAVPVEIEVATPGRAPSALAPATGTTRADTAAACGADTTDTGFGLLVNWNLLGDGEHTVRVVIDDVVFTERDITVTTLGPHPEQEYRRGLRATTAIPDFPAAGQTTTLRWAEALQNFVIASGERARGGEQLTPEQAWLENPAPGSFQSGLGVISGWVCEAERVEIAVTSDGPGEPWTVEAGAGTARADTADTCGAPDTGFGVLVNWNLLGDGQHTVRAYADGEEFAHSTVTVTTLGEEFARGLRQTHTIPDFPAPGQTTTVEWQEAQQNFVITAVK